MRKQRSSDHKYPLKDQIGSITGQTGSSGTILRSYTYDPYGNTTATTGTAWDDTIGYASGVNHHGGLIHFGARLYNPATTRWTQPDPLGGGLSQNYTYADGDPIGRIDPNGLRGCNAGRVRLEYTGRKRSNGQLEYRCVPRTDLGGLTDRGRNLTCTGVGVAAGIATLGLSAWAQIAAGAAASFWCGELIDEVTD